MQNPTELKTRLQVALNKEGYSFQQAVVKAFGELFGEGKSPWRLPTNEFPVECNGLATRIDVVLKHRSNSIWLVCECKRANPKFSDWCFVNSPFTERGQMANQIYCECLTWPDQDASPIAQANPLYSASDNVFHLGLELKGEGKGDAQGKPRGGIEDAVTQVMKGLNGLVSFLATSDRASSLKVMNLIPVVVTTASLWSSDVDLSNADLKTGEIDLKDSGLQPRKWLWYQYPQSPGLKHSLQQLQSESYDDLLAEALYAKYVRPVAIVNAAGLEAFCANGHFFHFGV